MPERTYRTLLWTLALSGLLLDLVSKYSVFAWLEHTPDCEQVLIGSAESGFKLAPGFERDSHGRLVHDGNGRAVPRVNQGALFGWLSHWGMSANSGFAVISLLAAVAIVYWSAHPSTSRDRWLCSALGLILAGTLGNFYDRVMFSGVRDFLHWNYGFDWPVFNFADCCLVVGAFALLIQAFLAQPAGNKATNPEATAAAGLTAAPKV